MLLRLIIATALILSLTAVAQAQDGPTFIVDASSDSGKGSLRAALAAASVSNGPSQIVVTAKTDITITDGLIFSGSFPLTIIGSGQIVRTAENVTLLSITKGADLAVTSLGFFGPGGFNIEKRGDLGLLAGKGIAVTVPPSATGSVKLNLTDVTVKDVAGHGVHISDCSLADACGAGSGGGGNGSAASLDIRLTNVTIEGVGHGRFDADGFRADERGDGSIVFAASGSSFLRAGADGVELDEGNTGDIIASITNSKFIGNGNYCDPTVLAAFMPAEPEGEFDDGQFAQDAVPAPVTNAPDNGCIERTFDLYDSGFVEEYEFAIDLDDGIDLDEAGAGSLITIVHNSVISGNFDEGVDWDEAGDGGIYATFVGTDAMLNTDDGYKLSEEDGGDIVSRVQMAKAVANGGKGFVFEEEGDGNLSVTITNSQALKNDDGDDTGIEVVQDDAGKGSLTTINSDIADGFDMSGVSMN